ncbi:MAG: hypothetical protein K6A77_04260 [Clostridiales bacterium]|nr:hypothetical protein [Clostridiales bacterium]
MNMKQIDNKLRQAAKDWKPEWDDSIKERRVAQAVGDEWYLEGTKRRKTRPALKFAAYAMAAIACFAAVFVPRTQLLARVDSVVYLDVNPSVSLEVNKKDKVLRAEAHNEDGKKILADMDLKGSNIDVAVNALIGSMFRQGYLTEERSTVLLSIESRDAQHAESLRLELAEEINAYLTQLVGNGSVYDQSVAPEEILEEKAKQYHITPGKAFLIQRLIEADSSLSYDDLARMNMSELARLLHRHGHALKEYLNLHGIDLDDIDDLDDLVEEVLEPEDDHDDDDSDEIDDVDDDHDDDTDEIDDVDDDHDDDTDEIDDVDDDHDDDPEEIDDVDDVHDDDPDEAEIDDDDDDDDDDAEEDDADDVDDDEDEDDDEDDD